MNEKRQIPEVTVGTYGTGYRSKHPPNSKRTTIAVACEECRRRKTKCNGQRPQCLGCQKLDLECTYEFEQGERSRVAALKRKYNTSELELKQMRALFDLLKRRPRAEAEKILAGIRAGDDISTITQSADGHVLPSSPTSSDGSWTEEDIMQLDAEMLEKCPIQVSALPWTTAADDGFVSELISSFFVVDDAFYLPFIHRNSFLEDMRKQKPEEARYCSPFLVNAICATRCFTSDHAKRVKRHTHLDSGARFLDEAKRALELERGRASLATVQGLALLFAISVSMGLDRACAPYRYTAYEMLKRLRLEQRYRKLESEASGHQECIALSKSLWGLFCFESLTAFFFLQSSLMEPPNIPRIFEGHDEAMSYQQDGLNGPNGICEQNHSSLLPGILNAFCDLSLLLYETMQYNGQPNTEFGGFDDIKSRKELYRKLTRWRDAIPSNLREDTNFTPQTCYLTVYMSEVALSIWRPVDPDTFIEDERVSVRDLCIRHCRLGTTLMSQYFKRWLFNQEYSYMAVCALYNSSVTVAPWLADPRTHGTFLQACYLLRRTAKDFPVSIHILQGLQALAWGLNQQIPIEGNAVFQNLGSSRESLQDVPMGFVLPQHGDLTGVLSNDGQDKSGRGCELGALLARWSATTNQ